jgi:ankyrin repeat protein
MENYINFLKKKEYHKAIEFISKIDTGINEIKDKFGNTMLHFAVIESNEEIIKLLLNKGADINKQYINGNTVLHEAIKKNSPGIIKLLLDNGADIFIENHSSISPVDLTIETGNIDIFKIIIENNVNKQAKNGDTILMKVIIKLFTNERELVMTQKWKTDHNAWLFGNTDQYYRKKDIFLQMFKTLLEKNADIDTIENNGYNEKRTKYTALTLVKDYYKNQCKEIKEYLENELHQRQNLLFLYSYINRERDNDTILSDIHGSLLDDDAIISKILDYI